MAIIENHPDTALSLKVIMRLNRSLDCPFCQTKAVILHDELAKCIMLSTITLMMTQ